MLDNLKCTYITAHAKSIPEGGHVTSIPTRSDIAMILGTAPELLAGSDCMMEGPIEMRTAVFVGNQSAVEHMGVNTPASNLLHGSKVLNGDVNADRIAVYGPAVVYYSEDGDLIEDVKKAAERADA